MTDQGKGSTRRPQQVSDQVLAENWERAFGTKIRKCMITQDGFIDMPMFSRGSGCKTSTAACEIARTIQDSIHLDDSLPDDFVGVIEVGDYLRPAKFHPVIRRKR